MFWQDFYDATLYIWLLAGIVLMLRLRVFSPGPLRKAPPRLSTLSLPVVGGVFLLYLIVGVTASVLAIATHLMPADMPNDAAATLYAPPASTMASATNSAAQTSTTAATTIQAPASTENDSANAPAATEPASAPASKDYTLIDQAVGGGAELLVVGLFAAVAGFLFRDGYRGWGLAPAQIMPGLLAGVVGFLVVFPLLILSELLSEWFIIHFLNRQMFVHPTFQALQLNPPLFDRISLFFLAAVVAPVAEEIFFRGLLQTTLIQYGWGFLVPQLNARLKPPPDHHPPAYQRWAAIGIASLAFAAAHPPDHRLVIFLLSASLGYVYERTGNLWAPITLHALFNSMSIWMNS